MMTEKTTCPTCGTPVEVVQADEGTAHYRPTQQTYTREELLSHEAKAAAQEAVRLSLPPVGFAERGPGINVAETAEEAIEAALDAIDKQKGGEDA